MELDTLRDMLHPVSEKDENKYINFSYSKLALFKQCPLKYKLKYIDSQFSTRSSLAMEIGTIYHKALEQKGKLLAVGAPVEYDAIESMIQDGCTDDDGEHIKGLKELSRQYWSEYSEPDSATGATYKEKYELFCKEVLRSEMEDTDWTPFAFEHRFCFIYDNGQRPVILHGFIDRIDTKVINGETHYKVVDYKSSKKVFRDEDLTTSMQFFIYALAVFFEFGVFPDEFEYRFILINNRQRAMTKGWLARGIRMLDRLIKKEAECRKTYTFEPSPCQLCYWCDFASHTPMSDPLYNHCCDYYSMWTPTNKTFEVHKPWIGAQKETTVQPSQRKMLW